MARLQLACTVRGCALPLERHARAVACPRGHAYDVARSGYINLLQPQDRRSRSAGDRRAAIEARARLLSAGIGRAILDLIVERAARLDLGDDPVVIDLGSGSGELLGAVARRRSIAGAGIDIAATAAAGAARRFPGLTWIVANADRRLPIVDRSVQLVLSLHGRRNPTECARILSPGGFLIVALPAADDLIELRTRVDGQHVERERGSSVVREHAPAFTLIERVTVREQQRLERGPLLELLRGTYRGERTSAAARVEALTAMDVTLASDVFLFAVGPDQTGP